MSDINIDNYYTKARDVGDRVNFLLAPLIDNFSFYDFCDHPQASDNGAFLVITNKQYVLGYNAGFGLGAHVYAFARCMKDIKGGGNILSNREAFQLENELANKFIQARIIYERYEDDLSHQVSNVGYIVFVLATNNGNKTFTNQQYEQFMKFYNDYRDEIKYVCKKFSFTVNYTCQDENGKICHNVYQDLENVKKYMENHLVDVDTIDDEVILNGSKTK